MRYKAITVGSLHFFSEVGQEVRLSGTLCVRIFFTALVNLILPSKFSVGFSNRLE